MEKTLEPNQKPQDKAFEEWKRDFPFVPYEWNSHRESFNAGFEAGARYAFSKITDSFIDPIIKRYLWPRI